MMGRLTFKPREPREGYMESFSVWKHNDYLGDVEKRIIYGKNIFWFFPDDFSMIGDMWFSDDCLREIADKLTELNNG